MLKATLELLLAVCIVLIGKRLINRFNKWYSFKKIQLTENELAVFEQKLKNYVHTRRIKSDFTEKEHMNIAFFASIKLDEDASDFEKELVSLYRATITKMVGIACNEPKVG